MVCRWLQVCLAAPGDAPGEMGVIGVVGVLGVVGVYGGLEEKKNLKIIILFLSFNLIIDSAEDIFIRKYE